MYEYMAVVTGVHDGDTLRMEVDLGFSVHILTPTLNNLPASLRIFGFDAPELGRPDTLGEQALAFVLEWLKANPGPYMIHTIKDHTDKYGRYLVDQVTSIITAKDLIQAEIAAGWLKPYSGQGPKPVWP